VTDQEVFTKYSKKGAYHWAETSHDIKKHNAYVSARYDLAIKALGDNSGQRSLDIGCGDGVLAWRLVDNGADAVGVDPVKDALQFANRVRNVELNRKPFFLCANAEKLPFLDESFSSALCTDVIEHLSDPEMLLLESNRILKPGGKFVLTTPNKIAPEMTDPEHKREFTVSELTELLEKYFANVYVFESHPEFWRQVYLSRPWFFRKKSILKYLINFLAIYLGYNPFLRVKRLGQTHLFTQLTAVAMK